MNSTDFEIALYELSNNEHNPIDVYLALQSFETEIENLDYESLDMTMIASYLHNIYRIQSSSIKTMVIKVCCSLELIAPETIAEQYHFDYLVAESICQNPPTPTPKIDEEKCSAFRYVSVLLKYRKFLPKSIIQALICLYNTPNNQYKNLLASYLGEVVLVCRDDIADIPEISQVLVSNLIDFGNKTIVGLFSYAIEKRFQIMEDKGVLLNLLAP